MRRRTFGERMDLAIKLWIVFVAFIFLALTLGVVSAVTQKILPLVLVGICVVMGSLFAAVSMWVRYHEKKLPKSFRYQGKN